MSLTRRLTVTLFISAFLLFCCQPMVGKMVLPSLGGAASVWNTCVLFFQAMLLAGYVYAYILGKLGALRLQLMIHLALLLLVFLSLPIRLAADAIPDGAASPVVWELGQLLRSVALPFFVVSTTAPLLQSWFSKTGDEGAKDPYFLYAASNAGSLLSLMLYPFFIEPLFGISAQSNVWAVGYALLVVLVLTSIASFWRISPRIEEIEPASPPSWRARALWLAASFVPSALMIAVTTHLSQNLAAVPFLWTLPLAVYLLTFILAFGRRFRVSAEQISRWSPIALLLLIPIFMVGPILKTVLYLGLLAAHLLLLFVGGLLCHTTLAVHRPKTHSLSEYYAWIALGGVLGGVFAVIVAPSIFSSVQEYPLLVAALAFFRRPQDTGLKRWDWMFPVIVADALAVGWGVFWILGIKIQVAHIWTILGYCLLALAAFVIHRRRWVFGGMALVAVIYVLVFLPPIEKGEQIYIARDFFGVKKVFFDPSTNQRKLLHGDTLHGLEGLDPARAGVPLSYYTRTGPLGDVMEMLERRPQQEIGIVGLGSGTIAAYTRPDRRITFYEIDPQMVVVATRYFSFFNRCGTACSVVLGDGRLSIRKEPDGKFDLLVFDAFNSDSVPAHLLSREALEIYKTKLKPHGILLFHVSNRYLRVADLVCALAIDAKMPALYRIDTDVNQLGKAQSIYVMTALSPGVFDDLPANHRWKQVSPVKPMEPWTDDYSNLWALMRLR